jgi:hypothetical protein
MVSFMISITNLPIYVDMTENPRCAELIKSLAPHMYVPIEHELQPSEVPSPIGSEISLPDVLREQVVIDRDKYRVYAPSSISNLSRNDTGSWPRWKPRREAAWSWTPEDMPTLTQPQFQFQPGGGFEFKPSKFSDVFDITHLH